MAARLFVARLPWAVTKETLAKHFTQFGSVVDSAVVLERETGRSKGFGFVTMESPEASERALAFPEHEIEGRKVVVKAATARPERSEEGYSRSPRGDRQGGNY